MPTNFGGFQIPSTVVLRVRVSLGDSRSPASPGVKLVSLSTNGAAIPIAAPDFSQVTDGYYELALATADLQPGTYNYVVQAGTDPLNMTVAQDRFVLVAAT